MNYKELLRVPKQPKRVEAPSERLLHLRRTSRFCFISEAQWNSRHDWQADGKCKACGITAAEYPQEHTP